MSGYTLGVIGCGTMGIAVLSGVIDSQRALQQMRENGGGAPADVSLASSVASLGEEEELQQLPDRFIACVNRPESGKRLRKTFEQAGYTISPASSLSGSTETTTSKGKGKDAGDEHAKGEIRVLVRGNLACAQEADVVLLACKPHIVKEVLAEPGVKEALSGKLVCSICAGLRIEQIRQWVTPETKVVRAMPNTPAKVSDA